MAISLETAGAAFVLCVHGGRLWRK